MEVDFVPGDWRHGVDPAVVERKLAEDRARKIKAVMVVHNETSTGVTSPVSEVRKAIDRADHPALFMVDTISSLGCMDYQHDGWGVDVTVSCSQKGLMLPPGLGFNAISDKALAASKTARLPRSYWDWQAMISTNKSGFFPYTPATNLLYGLHESVRMLLEEGLEHVFARHRRLGEATRQAVRAWELELLCMNPEEYSSSLTAVLMPKGHDADAFRKVILDKFNLSLGSGLGKVKGKYLPDRPLGRLQRPDAGRDALRPGDGVCDGRCAILQRRDPGSPRLPFDPLNPIFATQIQRPYPVATARSISLMGETRSKGRSP